MNLRSTFFGGDTYVHTANTHLTGAARPVYPSSTTDFELSEVKASHHLKSPMESEWEFANSNATNVYSFEIGTSRDMDQL